ncbi:MAG: DinB family protein [Phototrophicaceae bacterium]
MLIDAIRGWQLSQLEKQVFILKNALATVSDAAMTSYRDGGTGWTALEVLCHLRDFEELFLVRAQMTVEEDNPALPFPDPDRLADERNYNDDNPTMVLAHWVALRKDHLNYLDARAESDWERVAAHPTRGAFTLYDQLFLTVWHDTNHLEQILRILTEKRS